MCDSKKGRYCPGREPARILRARLAEAAQRAEQATQTVRLDPTPKNRATAAQAVSNHRDAYARWVATREGQAWAKKEQARAVKAGDPVRAAVIRQHATVSATQRTPSTTERTPGRTTTAAGTPAPTSDRVGATRPTVTLQPVKSNAIRAIGYDKSTGRCEVEMHTRPGRPYAYRMTPTEYRKFRAAPSLGAHFAQHVAGNADVAYPDKESWEADATQRRCARCGQWAGSSHVCDNPTLDETSSAVKTDRTDTATIRTTTGLTQTAWQGRLTVGQFTVPVDATTNPTTTDDGYRVTGVVTGTYTDGRWTVGSGPGELTCSCGSTGECSHREEVTAAVAQTVNPTKAPAGAQSALSTARDAAAVEHYKAEERHARLPERDTPEVMYSNDPAVFEADVTTATERAATGASPVTYVRENALDGLSDPNGGRGFGVELEFEFPSEWDDDRKDQARHAIATDLHHQGLTRTDTVRDWADQPSHYPDKHEGGWSVTTDASCAGEVTSPVMYDEPDTWENLEKVCHTIERHGGRTSRWTGGHVHVSTFDYDHTVENHSRLAQMWRDHQDTMFRLGSTPGQGHRGFGYCMPNKMPATGFTSWDNLTEHTQEDRNVPVNFAPTIRPDTEHGHVEFRAWDGSLDPATIQARIKLSVAMTDAAFRDRGYTSTGPEPVGMHAAQYGTATPPAPPGADPDTGLDPVRARSTKSVRRLADLLFTRHEDKAQVAGLFATTTWVDTRRPRP